MIAGPGMARWNPIRRLLEDGVVTAHVFVDEVKDGGYLIAAAAVLPGEVATARKKIRSLVLAGQRHLHFHKERDSRRKQILDVIDELAPQVTIYDATGIMPKKRRRDACLQQLITDLADSGARRLILDRDDSVVEVDKKLLYRCTRQAGCPDLEYLHSRAHEEELLAVPDAVAWCWHRGGAWKKRVEPLVAAVRSLR